MHLVNAVTNHSLTHMTGDPGGSNRELYDEILRRGSAEKTLHRARIFLDTQLSRADSMTCDIPTSPEHLLTWVRKNSEKSSQAYAQYLAERHEGSSRRYFTNRAHALYFLKHVAPTKLVDGAWLYGLLPYWRDMRIRPLVRTYLEELGDGVPSQNHVYLYKQLLASTGCENLEDIDDGYFLAGAQQLALGYLGEEFFPEVLGYNLGYEQLPLHLLITTYELSELGIDPYYFRLHATIDNASCGHAQKAVKALLGALQGSGNPADFMNRVRRGYCLNDLGISSTQISFSFDLERETLKMLEKKRKSATNIHSDYARIGGRTVNQWLSEPGKMADFMSALQSHGWIRRHENPQNSRFWQLIAGDRAPMFGVFDLYEQQLLHDWISGKSYEKIHRSRRSAVDLDSPSPPSPIDSDASLLWQQMQNLPSTRREARLIELMSPATHDTPVGLLATRIFNDNLQ